ncbi:MAG: hypothetical protein AB7O67_01630 [Vicinamibacterales bacterium]
MRRSIFLSLLLAATLLRIAALPLPGTEDVGVWRVWSYAGSQDVLGVYGVGGTPPARPRLEFRGIYTTVDYPPVAIYEMAIVGDAFRAVFPEYPNDWRLTAAVKLPGLLAGLGITACLYLVVLRLTGSVTHARWAALAWWANPAAILNAEVLGYLDPLMILPALLALVCLHLDRPIWAGALYAVALLTKPQALLLGPAMLIATWQTGGLRRLCTTGLAGAAWLGVGVLPYVLIGALPNMLQAFGSFAARRDIVSAYAANLWWVATWLARGVNMIPEFGFPGAYFEPVARILAISSWTEMGLPNPRPFGTALVALAVVLLLVRGWRAQRLDQHAAIGALTVHAFFVFGVAVHEHHMMLAVPLLVLAAGLNPVFRPIAWAVSAVVALNLNLFYGVGRGLGWAVPRMLTPIDLSVLLALANIALLVWHARTAWTALAAEPAARPQAA